MRSVVKSTCDYMRRVRRLDRSIGLYFAAVALSSIALGIFSVAFNLYILSVGIGEGKLGAIVGAGPFATALVAIPVAFAAEIIGYKSSFLIILAITGATQLARVATASVPVILVAAFIGGLGSAGEFVVKLPFLADYSDASNRTLVFSLNTLLTSVATAVGTVLAGYMPNMERLALVDLSLAYRYTLYFASALTLLGLVPLWFIKARKPKERKRISLAPYLWGIDRCTVKLACLSLFRGLNMGFVNPFLNIYFINHLGTTREFFSNVSALAIIPIMIGVALGPQLAKRIGTVRAITVLRWGIPVPALVMALTTNPITAAVAEWVHRGTSMMETPLSFSYSMEVATERTRAATAAWLHVTFVLGTAAAAPITGLCLAQANYRLPFYLSAVSMAAAGLLNEVFFGVRAARQQMKERTAA